MENGLGLIQVYTGKGKGKTTAALGLGLRAVGQGYRVLMVQFIKGKWFYGELESLKKLFPQFEIVQMGKGIVQKGKGLRDVDDEDRELAMQALSFCEEQMFSGKYDVVILDEINNSLAKGYIPITRVIDLLNKKPPKVEVILTGRNAPEEIVKRADLVTEMHAVRHPFDKGIKARKGIEI